MLHTCVSETKYITVIILYHLMHTDCIYIYTTMSTVHSAIYLDYGFYNTVQMYMYLECMFKLHAAYQCKSYSYTSDLSVKIFLVNVSGAIHLSGILSWREDTYSGVSLERPKSDILSSFPSSTRMLRQARSRWRTPREERYSWGG